MFIAKAVLPMLGRPATDQLMATRAKVEAVNDAMGDEKFRALVDDLRRAICRADTDPSLQHQARLAISEDGPSIEECKRRLAVRLAELRNL